VTLGCQPEGYWSGDRLAAREANPLGLWLLRWHLLGFAGGAVALLGLYALLLVRLPANLARVAAFVILFGHSVWVATWLVRGGVAGTVVAMVLLLAATWVLDWCWRE
jgi:hypothetical protein